MLSFISKQFVKSLTFEDHFIQGLYASLIQIIISFFIKELTKYYSILAVIIQDNKEPKNIPKIFKRFMSKIRYKIFWFYFIEIVTSFAFGIYLSTFLHVYKHTIVPLIISSIISMVLSVIYSIGICLLLVLTTIWGIKYEVLIIYKISLFLQCLVMN